MELSFGHVKDQMIYYNRAMNPAGSVQHRCQSPSNYLQATHKELFLLFVLFYYIALEYSKDS